MRPDSLSSLTSFLAMMAVLLLPWVAGAGSPLEPRPSTNDNYGESFSFTVDLDDGSLVTAQFSITNIGPGSKTGVCRATVLRPGRKVWSPQARVDSDEWSFDAATNTLKMGACTLHAGNGTHVSIPLGDGLVNIAFAELPTVQLVPGAEVVVGNARYRHEVLLPFSAAKVSLRLPGSETTLELTGGGYGDHSHSTVAPAKLARHWVRFRALRGETNLLLLGREGLDGGFGPVYLWNPGSAPQPLQSFALRRKDPEGAKVAVWEAELSSAQGPVTLRSTSLLLRNAPVQDLGVLGSLVKPVVGSPVTYVMRAVLERPGQPALPGVMEVTLDEG
jgi:hypothetical protein